MLQMELNVNFDPITNDDQRKNMFQSYKSSSIWSLFAAFATSSEFHTTFWDSYDVGKFWNASMSRANLLGQAMADVTLSEGFAQGKHVARAEFETSWWRPGVAPLSKMEFSPFEACDLPSNLT